MLLNASGCLDALTAPEVARSLDAFVTKTVTPLPREGNEAIRIAESQGGMLNTIGLANPGIEAFVAETLPRLVDTLEGTPLWVSVGGFSAADYAQLCALLDGQREVAAVELNLSCPNVEEAPETAAQIVAAARAVTRKPLYAKLSPAIWDVGTVVMAVEEAGVDGLSLVNTIRGMALDRTLAPALSRATGGFSGPPLKPIALAAVYAAAQATRLPIVGMGGIWTGRDALELIAAGASSCALGTVLFADPQAPGRIRRELEQEARSLGFPTALHAHGVALSQALRQQQGPAKILPLAREN